MDETRLNETEFDIDTPRFAPLSMEEAEAIRGGMQGAAGTCVAVGGACNSSGGVRGGICVIAGVVSNAIWWKWF